ncbi:RAD51-associated protein 1 [Nannospalax galili]|uniref:RAD51 associated protein 1 n=1 Tax=Nannospalax galili TaxID=1026970 RepID=A0A8C6RZ69_NANGA|nr:RAD51-associated protein 1 [Nannospalax galili]
MVRPSRNKKPVNYSQFQDSDSDDDFIPATVPPNKKSKIIQKELKQDKPKSNVKSLQKEDIIPEKTPKKRVALDDKVFQRGLEVALALSVKECPAVSSWEQQSQEKSTEKQDSSKTEIVNKAPRLSNCSVASDRLDGLDEITEENVCGAEGKRKAAWKAEAQQRRMLLEGSDGSTANDTEPDSETGKASEDDSDFDESRGSDGDFVVKKSKVKEIKKKDVKRKSPVEKKEKNSKSKCSASVTSGDAAPAVIKSEAPSLPKAVSLSSEATRKPAKMCSPSSEGKRPKWVPPAASGSSSASRSSSPLVGASKSPNQSLRLGLSRLARVKPLHPNSTSQVW